MLLFLLSLFYSDTKKHTTAFFHHLSHYSSHTAHLTPGGGVPVETRLKVTGHLGQRPGGHGPAVEGSQGPLIPHVKTLNLSWFNTTFTILGALRKDKEWLIFIRMSHYFHQVAMSQRKLQVHLMFVKKSQSWPKIRVLLPSMSIKCVKNDKKEIVLKTYTILGLK